MLTPDGGVMEMTLERRGGEEMERGERERISLCR